MAYLRVIVLCCLMVMCGCSLIRKAQKAYEVKKAAEQVLEVIKPLKEVMLERWHYDADTVHPDQ